MLLPFDIDALRKDVADGKPEAETSDKYFGPFHPTKFFLPGPAGYDATFVASGFDTHFGKPIVVEITGAAFVYELDGPNNIEKEDPPPKELIEAFPGIRRILSEAHVRYVFERFGVPYVVSIQCYDMQPVVEASWRARKPIRSRRPSCAGCAPPAARRRNCRNRNPTSAGRRQNRISPITARAI